MIEISAKKSLASMLKELHSIRVNGPSELGSWYDRATAIEEFARIHNCELPEGIHHYLSDADIRLKDPDYGCLTPQAAGAETALTL
ncbi:MAG: hypothetical protein AAGF35_15110, partial [Pseudomonadota bacterium]